jgi:general secretion pathway protein D
LIADFGFGATIFFNQQSNINNQEFAREGESTMRIFKTILVGMILAVAIIPLPGHTAATQSPPPPTAAPQTPAPPAAPPETAAPPAAAPQPAPTPTPVSLSSPAASQPAGSEAKPPIEVVKNGELKLKLNFQDAPLQTVLEYLSETAGLTIVSPEPIASSRITLINRDAVPVKDAVNLINTVLKEKGLNAVLTGKTLKVVTLANASKENIPVRSVRDPNQVEQTESVSTYVIPISHITAAALIQNLQALLPEYATLTANVEGNALIITDTGTNVRRLLQIVKALDTHMATVTEIRVFRLKNADATTTATLINTIFQQQGTGGRGQQGGRGGQQGGGFNPIQMMMERMGGRGGPGGGMGGMRGQMGGGIGGGIGRGIGEGIGVVMSGAMGGGMGGQRGGRGGQQGGGTQQGGGVVNAQVVAAADTQTNSVVVRGPAELLDLVADVIKALDETDAKVATVRVFQLRYADALNTADVINQLFNAQSSSSSRSRSGNRGGGGFPGGGPMIFQGPFGGMQNDASASMVAVTAAADSRTNTVVVTGPESVLNVVEEVIKKLDSPLSNVADVKVFRLEYADASNTAQLINEIFGQSRTSSSSSRSSRSSSQQSQQVTFQRGGPGGMGGMGGMGGQQGGQTGSSSDITVVASADTRTNSVVVSGATETLAVIAQIIKELDENPAAERRIFVYALKNATATSLMTILNNLFQEMQALNQQVTGSRSSTTGGQRNAGGGAGGGGGMGGGMGGGQAGGGASASSSSSSNDLSEETYFEADPNTNSLLIMTSSKNYEKVKPTIEELDKPVGQVLIKVLFAELTHSNDVDWGSEFSMLNLRRGGDGTQSIGAFGRPLDLTTPGSATSPLGAGATGSSGLSIRTIQGALDLTLHALQETGKLNVLSRPYVLTRNNRMATITVADEVPIPTASTNSGNVGTTTTFTYRTDIGIVLEVTPSINDDGLVNMIVSPKITTQTGQTVQISEDLNPVVFSTRSATTRVAVMDGQTIVIGGLIQDQSSDTIKKVPLLGDIPIAGNLFKRTIKSKSKIELLIFLTPYVAKEPLDLTRISETEEQRSSLSKDKTAAEVYKRHMDAMKNEDLEPNQP